MMMMMCVCVCVCVVQSHQGDRNHRLTGKDKIKRGTFVLRVLAG